ncbi:MAG: TIGR03936 family radical SAM-associated protein [Anaerolineales bacterium]|jgi:radical SAM-linked protein
MTDIERFRYRIQFEKGEQIRFISHLDLHRTWERTLRRAGLPVYHSQGFKPRPKINLSRALPLGQTSNCELMDVWLEQEIAEPELLIRLKAAAPPGLILQDVARVPLSEGSLQSRITSAAYLATLPGKNDPDEVQRTVKRILRADQLARVRRKKEYDLRPLIEALEVITSSDEELMLSMRLAAREGASGRPEEVLLEMGYNPEQARIQRTEIFFRADN